MNSYIIIDLFPQIYKDFLRVYHIDLLEKLEDNNFLASHFLLLVRGLLESDKSFENQLSKLAKVDNLKENVDIFEKWAIS